MALVALPVLALAGVGTVVLSMTGTVAQTTQSRLGHMAASFSVQANRLTQTPSGSMLIGYDSNKPKPPVSKWVPSDWRLVPLQSTAMQVKTAHGIATIDGEAGRGWDRAFAGRFELLSGHAPATPSELLLSPSALSRIGVRVGGTVESADGQRSYEVVGTMRDLTAPESTPLIFGKFAAFPGAKVDVDWETTYYMAGPPVTWSDVLHLNHYGALVSSRALTQGADLPDPNTGWMIVATFAIIGAFMLLEVALLSGAAFMVGARQQQRGLAVLASVGADTRLLRTSVAVGGIVLGAAGALLGIGLGLFAAWVYMVLTSNGSTTQYYGFDASPPALAGLFLVAVIACWISAAVPARSASRFDVVAALRGARRPPKASGLRSAVGLLFVIVGAGITLLGGAILFVASTENPPPLIIQFSGPTALILGSITLELGAILGLPAVLRMVARLMTRIGSAGLISSRDLARNSGRSVPAIAVIMSTAFVSVFVMGLLSGEESLTTEQYQWSSPLNSTIIQYETDNNGSDQEPALPVTEAGAAQYAAKLDQIVKSPGAARAIDGAPDASPSDSNSNAGPSIAEPRLDRAAFCVFSDGANTLHCDAPQFLNQTGTGAKLLVGNAADLTAMLGQRPTAAAIAALASGGAVSLYPQYVEHGTVSIAWWTQRQLNRGANTMPGRTPSRTVKVPAVLDVPAHPGEFGVVISKATADRLGVHYVPRFVLADTATPPTPTQQDELNGYIALRSGAGHASQAFLNVELGPPHTAGGAAWIIVSIAAASMLGSAVIALSLARIDARRDEATLIAVGAKPRTQRLIAFWQALVIAGLGSIIGGVFGLIPVIALAASRSILFTPPWTALLTAMIGLPLLTGLIAAALRRVPRTVVPDRVSVS